MNTSQLYQNSLGRIYLMLKADFVSNKRSVLTLVATVLALAYFLPRLSILFEGLSHFNTSWVQGYTFGFPIIKGIIQAVFAIYFWNYVNQRIVHSQPTLFSTLPAKLWEKVVSLAIYGAGLNLICYLTIHLSFFLEYFTVPGMPFILERWDLPSLLPFTPFNPFTLTETYEITIRQGIVDLGLTSSHIILINACIWGIWLLLTGMMMTMMIYIRKSTIGFLAATLTGILLTVFYVFCTTQFRPIISNRITGYFTPYIIFSNIYIWTWASIFIYFTLRKLRSISS